MAEQKDSRRKKKRKLKSSEEEVGPSKASRIYHSDCENKPPKAEAGQRETREILQYGPWRNLELILSLQNKEIDLQKKVELAYAYVISRVSEEADDTSQEIETISISRVLVFLNKWVESLLISSEKSFRVEGNNPHSRTTGSCLDNTCWEILRFCLEESLKLHLSLSFSRDFLRVIRCIAGDALSRLSVASSHSQGEVVGNDEFKFYSTVLECITCVFSSHGGVSDENLDLWVLTVETLLELVKKTLDDKIVDGEMGIFALQFSCIVIEPFTRFLKVHPTRKSGFHDFVNKLIGPLLHLLNLLHQYTHSRNPGWAGKLLKLLKEVLSQGLFHPTHINGFMSLQSLSKYKTSNNGKEKDLKTVIKSYHRHLFDNLEKIMVKKNSLALGGLGELFSLYVDCAKKQNGITIGGGGYGHMEDEFTGQIFKNSSKNDCVITEKTQYLSGLSAETRKSLLDFFVEIMEPFLAEIDTYLQDKLEFGPMLLNAHCTLKSTNKILISFMHERIYVRTEDTSKGAFVNFLKLVYDMIMSFSSKFNHMLSSVIELGEGTHKEVINLIAKELIVAVRCLLEIEYDVVGNDLESLWLMILTHGAFGLILMDLPEPTILTSEIIHLGCQLINFYSELRQVNNLVFSLCKAVRRLVSVRDVEMCHSDSISCKPSLHYTSCAEIVRMVLCSQDFRLSINNAIKSIPEGQASGFIRQLTTDISESLIWMKGNCSLAVRNEPGKLNLNSCGLPYFNLQAEVLGRGLSELYVLILESMIVTGGNSIVVGVSLEDLMAVIRPSMSCLVALQPDSVNVFMSTVTGTSIDMSDKCKNQDVFTHWFVLFFFRLYMSSRSLYRQAICLMAPDTSKKMSEVMGDSFTAYSAKDWLKRTEETVEGYFSWVLQPSASLHTVIQLVFLCPQDAVVNCSPLIYVLNAMALQRLVDLNRLIKSLEYLLQMKDIMVHAKLTDDAGLSLQRKKSRRWRTLVSDLREEAADLTSFMMEFISLIAKNQFPISSHNDVMGPEMSGQTPPENDAWDFTIGAVNEKSLPTAIWWILCQNIDVWCDHASKKKLKMFLSVLIQSSLANANNFSSDFVNHYTDKPGHLKIITLRQISYELLSNSVLYEQRFACRHMASKFCKNLEKSVSPIFRNSGEFHLNAPPDWQEVLGSLESSFIVDSDYNNVVHDCSWAELISHTSNKLNLNSSKFRACQSLLKFLCWIPKRLISSKSLSIYATCILNLERLILGSLIEYRGALESHKQYELLRLLMSCRRAFKNLIMASGKEQMEASHSSLTPSLFARSFPVLWLLKSLSALIEIQNTVPDNAATQAKEMIFSLMDHTSYVFLTFGKDQFTHASQYLMYSASWEGKTNCFVASESDLTEDNSRWDSCKGIDAWNAVIIVADTLREQTQNLHGTVMETRCSGEVDICAGLQQLRKASSIISCFQGFLWGLASALDRIDGESCNLKRKSSRWKFEHIVKLQRCIDTFADFTSYFLNTLFLEDDKLLQNLSDAEELPMSEGHDNLSGTKESSSKSFEDAADMLHEKEQQHSRTAKDCSTSSNLFDESNKSVRKTRSRQKNEGVASFLAKVNLFEQQRLNKSLLLGFLRGENLEAAFFLRQLFIASSAILRINLHIKSSSLSASLVPIFVGISEVLLLEFVNKVEVPHPFSFVLLDGLVKFVEELGSQFSLADSTLTSNAYIKLLDLHLRAIGRCISLQGKGATLASHETESSTKTLDGQMGLPKSTLSYGRYCLDDFKARLRMSFKVFVEKPSELHLLSAVQAIEKALVGAQHGCMTNYEIHTGNSEGGKVSSTVAAGIDCLDLVLEYVKGSKRLSVIKRHIQGLVACLFNIILHLQGPNMFVTNVIPSRGYADPDTGSVILMSVEVLTRIFGKHAIFQMDTCYVSQSLHIPTSLFQNILRLKIAEVPPENNSLKSLDIRDTKFPKSMCACVVDRQFSIELYAACCRLLCTVIKHHKSESQRCIALLGDAVRVLLCCLEMVDVDPVLRRGYFSWKMQEGVKCACFLRRIYEEIRQQKDVLSRHCFQFLSNYIWIYSGYGPLNMGIKREIDEALRPGVYALIDACSADDLQHIHTAFGEGPCRSTLATLQHDYKLHFQYEGKV